MKLVRVPDLESGSDAFNFYSLQRWQGNVTSDPWLISQQDTVDKFPLSNFAATFGFIYLWDFLIGNEDRFFTFEIPGNNFGDPLKLRFDNLIATNKDRDNDLILIDQGRAFAKFDGINFLTTSVTTVGSLGYSWDEWVTRIGKGQITQSGLINRDSHELCKNIKAIIARSSYFLEATRRIRSQFSLVPSIPIVRSNEFAFDSPYRLLSQDNFTNFFNKRIELLLNVSIFCS